MRSARSVVLDLLATRVIPLTTVILPTCAPTREISSMLYCGLCKCCGVHPTCVLLNVQNMCVTKRCVDSKNNGKETTAAEMFETLDGVLAYDTQSQFSPVCGKILAERKLNNMKREKEYLVYPRAEFVEIVSVWPHYNLQISSAALTKSSLAHNYTSTNRSSGVRNIFTWTSHHRYV